MVELSGAQEKAQSTQRLVVRNTLLLVAGQVLGMPLSIVVNAIMARYLGPEDFGYMYLASTFAAFGFLAVIWGQAGTLPAMLAKDPTRVGTYMGTALAWRFATSFVVYAFMAGGCWLLGYNV